MTDGKKLAVARKLAEKQYRREKPVRNGTAPDPEEGSSEAASQITVEPLYVAMDSAANNATAMRKYVTSKQREQLQKRRRLREQPRERADRGVSFLQPGNGADSGNGPLKRPSQSSTVRPENVVSGSTGAARKDAARQNDRRGYGRRRGTNGKPDGQETGNTLNHLMEKQWRKKARRETTKRAAKSVKAAGTVRKGGKAVAATAARVAKRLGRALVPLASSAAVFLLTFAVIGGFIALILGSAFGIFFSGGKSGGSGDSDSMSLRDAVISINQGFESQLNTLRSEEDHDILEISGQQADWRDVLGVYAVKISSDPGGTLSVPVMNETRKELLRDIFWDMTSIRSWTEETPQDDTSDLGSGAVPLIAEYPTIPESSEPTEPTEDSEPVEVVTTLYIVIAHRTAQEMAAEYAFDAEQQGVLTQLLQPANAALWGQLLYGVAISGVPNADGWTYPLPEEAEISSPFGPRIHPIYGDLRNHNGVDLAAELGTPIFAVGAGTVTTAAYYDSSGNYVVIDHGDGYRSLYMHMVFFIVGSGDVVSAGQIIGYVGSTGDSTGPHLHLGLTYNGSYLDPLSLIFYIPPDTPMEPPEISP